MESESRKASTSEHKSKWHLDDSDEDETESRKTSTIEHKSKWHLDDSDEDETESRKTSTIEHKFKRHLDDSDEDETESRKASTIEYKSKRHFDDTHEDDSSSPSKHKKKVDIEGEKDQTSRNEDELSITKDRSAPEGHGSTVASFYNNLENKGLQERKQSRIFFMRNSNNWIKSYIISHCLELIRDRQVDDYPIVALDLGCGKGGDLRKWQKGNIRHLVCADIAETSVEQCKERYETTRNKGFSAEFIVADCTKTRIKNLMKNPERKIDLVSCQFAFHYCFESLQQAETMIQNISENLKRGGYFCATLPNAFEIMSRLKKSDGQSFGNEVYRIVFPDDRPETPPLFGDRYNFFLEGVVDCPEFLVHPGTFEKLANKWGLQLVWKRSFATVYNDALKDSEAQRLLSVMHALEVGRSFLAENFLHFSLTILRA
ncbi:mRNA cap guanine-N7 methyltransferase-like [Macrobrachium nipponense]|uniref:mRNA cap guanine-N7 methyltransferase-like n=1 Tax=Macrobrachium nipponense TaxID=159736 RepID=UPI0030C87024